MWWFVFVCCLAVVFGDNSDNAKNANVVESNFAITKEVVIELLSKKDAFKKQKDSPFDAFCVLDALGNQLIQKFNVAGIKYYRVNLIILGGLGSEASIGKCRDKSVLIRQMQVSLLLTESSNNPELWTSSFKLHNVRIKEQESNAMTWWLKSEPNVMQSLIQEGKLQPYEVPTKVTFDALAMRFPGAPWISKPTIPQMLEPLVPVNPISNSLPGNAAALKANYKALEENAKRLKRNDVRLRGGLPSLPGVLPPLPGVLPPLPGVLPPLPGVLPRMREIVPPSQVGGALPRRYDPLRRGGKSRRDAIAKRGSK